VNLRSRNILTAALVAVLASAGIVVSEASTAPAATSAPSGASTVYESSYDYDQVPHVRAAVVVKSKAKATHKRAAVTHKRAAPHVVKRKAVVTKLPRTNAAGWMVAFGNCIARHETPGSTHPYTQVNLAGSSASGRYQFINSTWRTWMKRAGFSGYSRALYAPPAVQDAVFYYTISHGGKGNWGPDHCG
jgi:muramidase (phage lysozyme)